MNIQLMMTSFLSALKLNPAELQEFGATLQTRINEAEADIKAVSANVERLLVAVSDLDAKLTALAGKIASTPATASTAEPATAEPATAEPATASSAEPATASTAEPATAPTAEAKTGA